MKNKNLMVVAIVAVLAIAAVGAGYIFLSGDDEPETMTIIIQDDEGVYFWVKGEGGDGYTAFKNACEEYEIENDTSKSEEYGASINSIFGLEMEQTEPPSEENEWGVYIYWSQYSFVDGEWVHNDVSIDKVKASDVEAIAFVYTDSNEMPLATPSEAKIWDMSDDGVVFAIESMSGLNFKINGTGTTVMDAFVDATTTYNTPLKSTGPEDNPNGIDSLFDIGMEMIEGPTEEHEYGVWAWWIQKIPAEDGDGWESSTEGMDQLKTSDISSMLIVYGSEDM